MRTTFLCFSNGCRWSTLVNKSAVFSAVSKYLTVTKPAPRNSRILYSLRSMCLECCVDV